MFQQNNQQELMQDFRARQIGRHILGAVFDMSMLK